MIVIFMILCEPTDNNLIMKGKIYIFLKILNVDYYPFYDLITNIFDFSL